MSNRRNSGNRRTTSGPRSRANSHSYDLRSSDLRSSKLGVGTRPNRSKSANSNKKSSKSSKKKSNYLGEKTFFVTVPKVNVQDVHVVSQMVPVFTVKGKDTTRTWDYTSKDPRENYMDIRTVDQQISDLQEEKKNIELDIADLQKLKAVQQKDTRPKNWKYKTEALRTTYFDEREFVDGSIPNIPRVVTVVWSYNRKTAIARIGAVQWTKGYSNDQFDKYAQRQFATQRYSSVPIIVKLKPAPKTHYEVQNCLRWIVHDLGVTSTSRQYKNLKSKIVTVEQHRDILKNPLAPGVKLF